MEDEHQKLETPSKYILEIKDINSGDTYEEWITTDDIKWSMEQYQRNRQPLTWELLDEDDCCGDNCCDDKEWEMEYIHGLGNRYTRPELDSATLEDLEMIHQGIVNHESDNS